MHAEPQEKLNPRIKAVWRISDTLMLTAAWLILASPGAIALLVDVSEAYWANPTCWYLPFCTRFFADRVPVCGNAASLHSLALRASS